jgi:uncharacterized damage-inducible protein DinB
MAASPIAHFQMLARYSTIANERLYEACGGLDEEEYRRERAASFRSVHRTLNHILLGDRIWMARFTETGHASTPALDSELYPDFASLKAARVAEDARIEAFLAGAAEEFLAKEVRYVNSAGDIRPPALDMHRVIRPEAPSRMQVTG